MSLVTCAYTSFAEQGLVTVKAMVSVQQSVRIMCHATVMPHAVRAALQEVVTVVAMLSVQSVWAPGEKKALDEAKMR